MADHFTVLILSSIRGQLVMPLTGFATRGTTACALEDTATQAIAELKAIGIDTVALCLDGASENRLLVSRLIHANTKIKVTDMQNPFVSFFEWITIALRCAFPYFYGRKRFILMDCFGIDLHLF